MPFLYNKKSGCVAKEPSLLIMKRGFSRVFTLLPLFLSFQKLRKHRQMQKEKIWKKPIKALKKHPPNSVIKNKKETNQSINKAKKSNKKKKKQLTNCCLFWYVVPYFRHFVPIDFLKRSRYVLIQHLQQNNRTRQGIYTCDWNWNEKSNQNEKKIKLKWMDVGLITWKVSWMLWTCDFRALASWFLLPFPISSHQSSLLNSRWCWKSNKIKFTDKKEQKSSA